MDSATKKSLEAVITYLLQAERKNWEEAGTPSKGHIYNDIERLCAFLKICPECNTQNLDDDGVCSYCGTFN